MADNAEKPSEPADEGAEPAAAPDAPPPADVPARTPAFRKGLLAKLSVLAYEATSVKDSFRLDDEWNALVNRKADAVLEPLDGLAPRRA
jgi:hypothetical protein